MKVIIKALYRKISGIVTGGTRIVEEELGGRKFRVQKGTIRKLPDMDDAWYACLAGRAKVILDIGSNVGYDALIAFAYGKPHRIVLVDPNPLALSVAAQNMIMNGYSRKCQFVSTLVSDSNGERVKLFTLGTGAAGSIFSSFADSARKLNSWYWAYTETVDSLVASQGIVPDLIKIDVEGAESKVLAGAIDVCAKYKVSIIVEMHSGQVLSMYDNANSVLSWCERARYQAWYMKEASKLDNPQAIANRGRCHLLLLPMGQDYPSSLGGIPQRSPLPMLEP